MDPTLPPLRSMTAMLSLTASRAIGRQRHLTIAALPRPTTALFLDDSRQCAERLVDFSRRRECGSYVGVQNHYGTPNSVLRGVLVGYSTTNIVFKKNLVGIRRFASLGSRDRHETTFPMPP